VKTALYNSGSDALFIRDFKIKFSKGKTGKPAKVAKYTVLLNDSTTYRFNIENAKEYDGKAILQLFLNGKQCGSTYNFDSLIYINRFDYTCTKEGYYQVYMSFLEGQSGCAAAVMSYLPTDSAVYNESEADDILYLKTENPIYIAFTEEDGCTLNVRTSQGLIWGYNGKYTLIPDTLGSLIITAQTIDSIGIVIEEIQKEFKVKPLPDPLVNFNGITPGLIEKEDLLSARKISLFYQTHHTNDDYQILGFEICLNFSSVDCKGSDNEYFSFGQIEMIKKMKSGDRFTIYNLKVKTPDGSLSLLKPAEFILK
jgi:hypothetical protein